MTSELISVIIPVYNVEGFLCRCVNSVLVQSYDNLEIILVDDGSTDQSGNICDQLLRRDERIKVIHKQNGGLSSARNTGLEVASGDYLLFVDSDDYIDKGMIEKLLKVLISENADISICDYEKVDEKGRSIKEDGQLFNMVIEDERKYDLIFKYTHIVVAWNKLYKKRIFANLVFEENRINEDEYIIHRVFEKCNKIAIIADKLYFYTQRQDSIMGRKKNHDIKSLDYIEALCDRCEFYREKELSTSECVKYLLNNYVSALYGLRLVSEEEKNRVKEIKRLVHRTVGEENLVGVKSILKLYFPHFVGEVVKMKKLGRHYLD